MRTYKILMAIGLVAALLVGCSEKQKEAAQMEQEMRDMEAADSAAGETGSTVDTLGAQQPMADAAAVPEETMPEPSPMPPAPEGEGYTVQVASCENDEYARYLIDVYSNRGYDAFVTTITFEGQTYYRVRIGNFEGLSEAKALQAELEDRYSETPWIDRLDQ